MAPIATHAGLKAVQLGLIPQQSKCIPVVSGL